MTTLDVTKQDTESLHKMVKALSSMPFFNTADDTARLEAAKRELARRNKKQGKGR